MSLFFYLFTIVINLWHQKFFIADVIAVLVNKRHGVQRREQDFDKKSLYFKTYTAKKDECPEKIWPKHCVNKLLKKLRDTGTVDIEPNATT